MNEGGREERERGHTTRKGSLDTATAVVIELEEVGDDARVMALGSMQSEVSAMARSGMVALWRRAALAGDWCSRQI